MENPEEILHSLEEFSKMKPKDIPRELEEYLCFVAKTGNPVYQWPTIKSLFREKLLSVITEFYESCPSVEIPPCPNVELFNYDLMKNFILEKLDTFASAPFTVQRICELLTTPRKEYNRIDKYMRALEKNILVVSTTEPGRRSTENGEGIMNGIESEHVPESSNSSHDINVEEMDESPSWPRTAQVAPVLFESTESENQSTTETQQNAPVQESFESSSDIKLDMPSSSTASSTQTQVQNQHETVITCRTLDETPQPYVSIEPVPLNTCITSHQEPPAENQADTSVTVTAVPAGVQQRRTSVERVGHVETTQVEPEDKEATVVKPANVPEKDAEVKEEVAPPSEPIEEPLVEEKAVLHSDEAVLVVQEESGIENVSPETNSSPETLQIDVQEQEKTQLERPEKDELVEAQPKIESVVEESVKWPEVKLLDETQQCVEPDTSVPEIKEVEVEDVTVVTEPICTEAIAEVEKTDASPCQTLDVDSSVVDCSEASVPVELVEERVDVKEAEPVSELPVSEPECKIDNEETPMEVDVLSEIELEKKEEPLQEEPSSSTSDAAAL